MIETILSPTRSDPKLPKPITPEATGSSVVVGQPPAETDPLEKSFCDLTSDEKRFHLLFYSLAATTGILIVQFVWQLAILTATP